MKIIKTKLAKALYSDQPVPMISDNISTFIANQLEEENYDFVVEYGTGNSTRYFLSKLIEFGKKCTFVAVEYNSKWFKALVKFIQTDLNSTPTAQEKFELKPWNIEKCKFFLQGKNTAFLDVPPELVRLRQAQRIFGGPFNIKMLLYRLIKGRRPIDGNYTLTIDNSINLILLLRSQLMKDQYGESPLKQEYISAGLAPVKQGLQSKKSMRAVFFIDGGPRSDILNSIFEIEKRNDNFSPTIFLCDANRAFYADAIQRRPTGVFLKGSNRTLSGEPIYKSLYKSRKTNFWYSKEETSPRALLEKEVWFYQIKNNNAA
jgi:hypothetical protein